MQRGHTGLSGLRTGGHLCLVKRLSGRHRRNRWRGHIHWWCCCCLTDWRGRRRGRREREPRARRHRHVSKWTSLICLSHLTHHRLHHLLHCIFLIPTNAQIQVSKSTLKSNQIQTLEEKVPQCIMKFNNFLLVTIIKTECLQTLIVAKLHIWSWCRGVDDTSTSSRAGGLTADTNL